MRNHLNIFKTELQIHIKSTYHYPLLSKNYYPDFGQSAFIRDFLSLTAKLKKLSTKLFSTIMGYMISYLVYLI